MTQNRLALGQISAKLPDGETLRMSSLRQFSGTQPLYKLGEDHKQLTTVQTARFIART